MAEINAVYEPFPGTSISLGGILQTVNSNGTVNENIAAKLFQISARQHVFHHFFLSLALGIGNYEYNFELPQSISDGNYFIEISSGNLKMTKKLLVSK